MGWFSNWRNKRAVRRQAIETPSAPPSEIVLTTPDDLLKYLPPDFELKTAITSHELLAKSQMGQPMWSTDWTLENSVRNGLRVCSWVFACVFRRCKSIASVPWYVEVKTSDGWQRQTEHPALDLINYPNDHWSRLDLFETMQMHLDLDGNSTWLKVRDGADNDGQLRELWCISPDRVAPIPGKEPGVYLDGYELRSADGTEVEAVKPSDMVHFQYKDPLNEYWGTPPIRSAGRAVDTDVEATKWNKTALQNRAVTDGVLTFANKLSQHQYDTVKEKVEDQHYGSSNARRVWILGGDAKWQQMSLTPVQMDFLEGRKFTRVEICSVYGVPPPLIGDYEKATLANIETSRTIFWLDTMVPLLDDCQDTLNRCIAWEFGDNVRYRYDLSKVQALFAILVQRIQAAKELWSMGVPLNVASAFVGLGLPDIPGGDVGYVASNLLQAGGVPEEL